MGALQDAEGALPEGSQRRLTGALRDGRGEMDPEAKLPRRRRALAVMVCGRWQRRAWRCPGDPAARAAAEDDATAAAAAAASAT